MSGSEGLDRLSLSRRTRRRAGRQAESGKDRKFIIEPHFAGRKSVL
jgi:hypothetical protein